jgi:hypothetical protein
MQRSERLHDLGVMLRIRRAAAGAPNPGGRGLLNPENFTRRGHFLSDQFCSNTRIRRLNTAFTRKPLDAAGPQKSNVRLTTIRNHSHKINCNLMNNVPIRTARNLFTKQSRFAGVLVARVRVPD